MGSELSSRSGVARKSAPAIWVGWIDARGSSMGSGLNSRLGLVHKSAPAIWVRWTGSDRCSEVANELWIELSLGFGAQKRAR